LIFECRQQRIGTDPNAGHRYTDGGNDLATLIPDWRTDALDTLLIFFIVESISLFPDVLEVGFEFLDSG